MCCRDAGSVGRPSSGSGPGPSPTGTATRSRLDRPGELVVDGCLVAPGNTAEEQSQGDTVTSGFTVYAPPDVDVTATDGVVVRGTRYRFSGSRPGGLPGTVIVLTRTEG
jgi:hypothetical protein